MNIEARLDYLTRMVNAKISVSNCVFDVTRFTVSEVAQMQKCSMEMIDRICMRLDPPVEPQRAARSGKYAALTLTGDQVRAISEYVKKNGYPT